MLDECVHVDLRHHLAGHEVLTVAYMKWKGLKNGRLLAEAVRNGFDVMVTTDRGVAYEQHLDVLPIAVVILNAATNDLADLLPLIPRLLTALNHVQPRSVTHIEAP